jgi:hypothetical protein
VNRWIRFGALAALPLLSPVLGCGNSVPSGQTRTDAGATLLDGGARPADGGSSDSDAAASCADDAVRCPADCTAFSDADCVGCGNPLRSLRRCWNSDGSHDCAAILEM